MRVGGGLEQGVRGMRSATSASRAREPSKCLSGGEDAMMQQSGDAVVVCGCAQIGR